MDYLPQLKPWQQYTVAVAALVVMTAMRLALEPVLGSQAPLVSYVLVVMVSALAGGFWLGVATTIASAFMGAYFFIVPYFTLSVRNPADVSFIGMFMLVGICVSWVCSVMRKANLRALDHAREASLRRAEAEKETGERQRALAAFQKAESDFRALFELGAVGMTQVDPTNGRLLRVNKTYCQMVGYTAEELTGMSFRELTHPEDRSKDFAAYQKAIQGGASTYTTEKRYVRKDGSIFWVLVTARFVRDAEGKLLYSFAAILDITERKAAEEALEREEARYRSLVEATSSIVWTTTPQGLFKGLQPTWGAFTGQSEADYANGKAGEMIHPDDQEYVRKTWKQNAPLRKPFRLFYRLRRYDGEYREVEANAVPVLEKNGAVREWVGFIQDVTEKRAAIREMEKTRQQLEVTVANMTEGLLVGDGEGKIIYANPSALELHGFASLEEVRRHLSDFYSRFEVRDTRGNLIPGEKWPSSRALRGESFTGFEMDVLCIDTGRHFYVSFNAAPIKDRDGRLLLSVMTLHDITERVRASQEREQLLVHAQTARAEAEAANKAKDHFLAILSHELRTPLAPVVPLLEELLSSNGVPANVREDLGVIRRNIVLEARLIDDLLDLTRVLRGKLELRKETVDVHELLERSRSICFTEEVQDKHLSISLELTAKKHWAVADPARLQQIFWNLINNALKFSHPGGVVAVRTSDAEDGNICIEVKDTGIGISTELLARLFQPFEQGERRSCNEQRGLGLGLAITKSLVEAHGGQVSVESAGQGKGAVFRVLLPATLPDRLHVAPHGNGETPRASKTGQSTKRLLLVEDHADTARVMERLLKSRGYAVQVAGTKAQALELGTREQFDVLVSDLGLPDGSGLEVMTELRKQSLFFGIAISGFGTDADLQKSKEAGFAEHLVKPVDFGELVRVIEGGVDG